MADVNWSRISKEIVLYSRNVFKEQNIVVQDGTIEQCVDMFYNVEKPCVRDPRSPSAVDPRKQV